jgi:hypothetical protein
MAPQAGHIKPFHLLAVSPAPTFHLNLSIDTV